METNLKICLDILRCPNTCRHCERVPGGGHYSLSLAEIRAMVERLVREAAAAGVGLTVCPAYKEPLAHPEYFEIQDYLDSVFPSARPSSSGGSWATNGWSIARDPGFLDRFRQRYPGQKIMQLTLTELGDAHDRFVGRKGAFHDLEVAADRILAAGLQICWIYILHGENVHRIEPMAEWARAKGCGSPDFRETIFLVKPQVRARGLKRVRRCDFERLPEHFRSLVGNWGMMMRRCLTEGEFVDALKRDALPGQREMGFTEPICVSEYCYNPNAANVTLELEVNGDLYPICHEHAPAFLLGNIHQTSLAELIDRYRRDAVPALYARRVLGLKELARRYGRPDSDEMHHGCSICRTLVNRHLGLEPHGDLAMDTK